MVSKLSAKKRSQKSFAIDENVELNISEDALGIKLKKFLCKK